MVVSSVNLKVITLMVLNLLHIMWHGRFMAGISVFVHCLLARTVIRLKFNSMFSIFLKFDKSFLQRDSDHCFTYLPPANSPAYNLINTKGINLLEEDIQHWNVKTVDFSFIW